MNNEAKLKSLTDLIEKLIPIKKWEFTRNISFFSRNRPDVPFGSGEPIYPTVIYDSHLCRIKFLLTNEDHYDFLIVYYGRKHAPDDERIITWQGKKCYCWCWDTYNLLFKYLDGNSPEVAANKRGEPPRKMKEFVTKNRKLISGQPEYNLKFHANAWESYNEKLFELFDLNRPELWNSYNKFVREYYNIVGIPQNINPPLNQIC